MELPVWTDDMKPTTTGADNEANPEKLEAPHPTALMTLPLTI